MYYLYKSHIENISEFRRGTLIVHILLLVENGQIIQTIDRVLYFRYYRVDIFIPKQFDGE